VNQNQAMQRLLSQTYLEERCNVCGETYPLTLYEILLEQRASAQWQSPRPDGATGVGYNRAAAVVPAEQLEAVAAAWEQLLLTLAEKGLTVQIGTPPPSAHNHPEPEH
jgi:hypothetical protein